MHRYTWDDTAGVSQLLGDHYVFYDAQQVFHSHDVSYLYGPDGLPFEQIDVDSVDGTESVWFHQDATGSVRCVTDGTGEVASKATFTPWGEVASSWTDGSHTLPKLGYKSQQMDPSGLIYLRARYYDPGTAQFLSVDPLFAVTGERYGYTGNNPINGSDPSGLNKCEVGANPVRWLGNAQDCVADSTSAPESVDDAWDATWSFYSQEYAYVADHGTLSVSSCVIICARLTYQNGHLKGGLGGSWGWSPLGASVGWNRSDSKGSAEWGPEIHSGACISIVLGICAGSEGRSGRFAHCEIGGGFGVSMEGGRERTVTIF